MTSPVSHAISGEPTMVGRNQTIGRRSPTLTTSSAVASAMYEPTPTSYIVLGLLEWAGRATPYDLKALAAQSVGNFWSIPHSQIYAEPDRLARAGYVSEERERGGRRRRTYELAQRGREALAAWRDEATDELPELRDLALLKVFFGGDPAAIAPRQLAAHRAKLAEYEARLETLPPGPATTLEAGIAHEREWVTYWERLAAAGAPPSRRASRRR
jgi:PadR family transcriptional regulator AphA